MSLNKIQEYATFELEYKVANKSQIKIFDSRFINANRNICKIIYNGKENEITECFKFDSNYNYNTIKIHLIINNNITDINYMFKDCKTLLSIKDIPVDNSNINNMNNFFYEYNSNNFNEKSDKSNVNEKSEIFDSGSLILSTFQKNTNISEFTGINDFNFFRENILKNVTNMSGMFSGCSSLITLPVISKWNTKNVTNMSDIFSGCSSLKALPDISKWNTKNVTNMTGIFSGCCSLISLPDISKWDTNKVTNMSGIFSGCSALIAFPDISKWNINHVTHM